ncbi:Z-DNA-binding protein 1 isoform X1 [Alligator sinensis]|uniref:Z-DNA-binding protein 1 isoform X1 n=1 Tax=Alligator sinensis TaxID=38654 RepID=A0A3Q0GQL9_ALLSI|nr:Z-DNA-binding protein 1 isoform X1 [Alligator sinensis]
MAKAASREASEVKQRILDYLRAAETPKKAIEVASGCSITKQEANKALYTLHKEGQVEKRDGGKWVVCADGTELESCCKTPQSAAADTALVPWGRRGNAVVPARNNSGLTETQERMCSYLHENGPQRALSIAKHLGKQTQKDVNPDLYALMRKHLLHFDEEQKLWSCYSKGADYKATGPKVKPSITYILQTNPINNISLPGDHSAVHISHSTATQIGHNNTANVMDKNNDCNPTAQSSLSSTKNAKSSYDDSEAKAAMPCDQDIQVTESTLRNVLVGNQNQMDVIKTDFVDSPAEQVGQCGTSEKDSFGQIPSSSSSFSLHNSTPNRTGGTSSQRLSINKSTLDNVMIGNANQMSVCDGIAFADLADLSANKDDDTSDSDSTSNEAERTSGDYSNLDQFSDISILCAMLKNTVFGNSNNLSIVELVDSESDSENGGE